MATIDFIKNLAVGDNIKAQDEINSVLSQMALDAVSSLKQEVAQNYFSGVQEESEQLEEKSGYSAKSAAAGKDIGKKGKNFAKIAKKAAEEYGSEESGKKVAGAILKKLRKEDVETLDEAKRIIHKYEPENAVHTAKVYRDPENDEYQVHFYKHGKHMGEGPVHYTDDKDDAVGTAKLQVDKLNK